jgi:hypothetical protein
LRHRTGRSCKVAFRRRPNCLPAPMYADQKAADGQMNVERLKGAYPMRVGVVSPNLLLNVEDHNAMYSDPDCPWPFESVAKKASLLFDKLYLTQDLDVTCSLLSSFEENDSKSETLRYLIAEGMILVPEDLGYSSGTRLIASNLVGIAADIDAQLRRVGNRTGIEDDEEYLTGQPDLGDFAESNGCHPRGGGLRTVREQQLMYESLLLRRNVSILHQAGLEGAAIVGRLLSDTKDVEHASPVWKVVIDEMPQLDTRCSWNDLFDFRAEARTQHLVRQLRRWVRKTVCETWTEAELQDEVRELLYEYETHLQIARMGSNKGTLEFFVTGTADLVEDLMKLRFSKIGKLVSVVRERRVQLLKGEADAPGRELALLSVLKTRF